MRKNYFSKKISLAAMLLTFALPGFSQTFTNGIFILNEGGAGSNNASVSFLGNGAGSVTNNIYATVNPSLDSLGDTAQSMSFNGDYAYVVLNISNAVKVVNRTTFEHIATISEGLVNPRYMAIVNGKGYITNWGNGGNAEDDYIAILDLETNTITGNIPVGEGVERILEHNGKLYVAHQGGYGQGNTVSVINTDTETVETVITVGDVPNKMVIKNETLYVLCGGNPYWAATETDGSLVTINLENNTVTSTVDFEGLHPAHLEIDEQDNIYFTSEADIFKSTLANVAAYTEIATLEPQAQYGIYGMNLIDNKLYVADAANYTSPGTAYILNTDGTQEASYTVGLLPNSFYKATETLDTPVANASKITAYPNPATGRFFLNTNSNPDVAIYDLSGKVVLQAKYTVNGVNISGIAGGIYMVQVSDNKGISTTKLIIK